LPIRFLLPEAAQLRVGFGQGATPRVQLQVNLGNTVVVRPRTVAGNADPNSGYMLVIEGQSLGPFGGTSAVAPLDAGLVALLNAGLSSWGYLNPTLYLSAKTAGLYQDIADGKSNATGGAKGYTSGPGWDACAGFGSINGTALIGAILNLLVPELATFTVDSPSRGVPFQSGRIE
jgi:subtilase family serine protease